MRIVRMMHVNVTTARREKMEPLDTKAIKDESWTAPELHGCLIKLYINLRPLGTQHCFFLGVSGLQQV